MPSTSTCKKDETRISFHELDASNFADFKLLHQTIFPVKYSVWSATNSDQVATAFVAGSV